MAEKPVFKNFTEYWYYARYLSREQRKIIFKSLPTKQKTGLDDSYLKEGWCDLFNRNDINERIDDLAQAYGYNLLEIRLKVLKGKSVYLPCKFWQIVQEQFERFSSEQVQFVLGGLIAEKCEENKDVCLIVYDP